MYASGEVSSRTARHSRPQLVCVLADNSGSMRGPKAEAATDGIRDMMWECRTRGPSRSDRSYYELVLVQFGTSAQLAYDRVPVKEIDADQFVLRGDGGGTNITEALEITHQRLVQYMEELETHPERNQYPLPLVLLFSDGHNGHGHPKPVADRIKSLRLDGCPVTIVCAGVATKASDEPDETLLRAIASSPECYLRIQSADMLSVFLAEVGSSGASSPAEVAQVIARIAHVRGLED